MGEYVKAVHNIAHHRNGVCGEPFYVVTFTMTENGHAAIATVFGERGAFNPATAVLSLALLAEGEISFGVNSWRGDTFTPELWDAIVAWEACDREKVTA